MVIRFSAGLVALLAGYSCLAAVADDQRLIEAAKSSRPEQVRALLQKGANASAKEVDGTTALDWAVSHDDVETVKLLIKAGADVKAVNRYGMSALLIGAHSASGPVVEQLLNAGADPNSATPEGETAVMTAARSGNIDVIRALYNKHADVNAKESWHHQTALMWAADGNYSAAITELKEFGADLNARSDGGFTPLLFAVRTGQLEAVETLLKLGANPNDTLQPQLKMGQSMARASSYGTPTTDHGRMIGSVGGNPLRPAGPEGTSALVLAIANAHFAVAKFLVEHGADVNASAQGWTPLIQIAYTRRPNHGKGLPPPEATDPTDTLELAKLLIAHGADVNFRQKMEINDGQRNYQNRVGATAFFIAAKNADPPLMRLLAENHADVNIGTEDHATPLAAAAGVGIWNVGESAGTNEEALEATKLAWELGSRDVNKADDFGFTPLHGAALRGSAEIVQFLADHGADLAAVTREEKWTALRIADGVYYTGTVKRGRDAGTMLRKLMVQKGLPVPEFKDDVDYGLSQAAGN